jgi:transposase InsO family protein
MPWKEIDAMNQRIEFVLRALETENFRELCREYGISAKTGYKWKERFLEYGLAGMREESRRPKSSPGGLEEAVVCEIVRLKERRRNWGPRKLRDLYMRAHGQAPSESSFKRVLERAGMVERRRLRKRQETGRLFTGRRAKEPNEVWTVDFKGWWYTAGGRCEPLTVRDEASRYVLELRCLADARTETVRACFEGLFERYGVPEAIRSDNGSPFANVEGVLGLTRLSAWWVTLGIDLERGRPGCPQDNGGHERLHLDIGRELEAHRLGEYQSELEEWRKIFNEERPHEALGMRRPAEVYCRSNRVYTGTPEDVEYPKLISRRVVSHGRIAWKGQRIFISTALAGWSVGLEPSGADHWNVWFGRLLLGQLEDSSASFVRATENQTVAGAPAP